MGVLDWTNILQDIGAGVPFVGDMINYHNQQQNTKYQKKLQQQIFEREDNAVQRRKADLIAAGLSPVLAAGSAAGSGGIVSTTAPQGNSKALSEALNLAQQRESIKQTQAQTSLIEKQKEKIDPEINQINALKKKADSDTLLNNATTKMRGVETNVKSIEGGIKSVELDKNKYDLSLTKETGMSSNPGVLGQTSMDIAGALSKLFGTHPMQKDMLNNQTKNALLGASVLGASGSW